MLSNWTSSVEMDIVGGEPPNIHDVRGEENLRQARVLCSIIFRDDYDSRWSPALREMLFASLLRFYPNFVSLLEQHPESKCKNLKSHPFTRRIFECLDMIKVDVSVFEDWCVDVRKGFLRRNCIAPPINVLADGGYDGLSETQVDARSFLYQVNTLTHAHMAVSNHTSSNAEDLKWIIDRQDRLEKKQDKTLELLEKLSESKQKESEDDRLVFNEVVETCASPSRLFVHFLSESLHRPCHDQLKSCSPLPAGGFRIWDNRIPSLPN